MYFEILTVTPEMAENWLKKNIPNNRTISSAKRYQKDVEAGNWKLTHQAIAFSESGYLIDGQNRLTAIVNAKKSVQMAVAFDCPNDSIEVLDIGKARTLGDLMKMQNLPHANHLAATCAKILSYQKGRTNIFQAISMSGQQGGAGARIQDTRKEQLTFFEENKNDIIKCTNFGVQVYTASPYLLSPSEIGLVYWMLGMSSDANEFISKVIIGINVSIDTSPYHLRKILQDWKNKTRVLSGEDRIEYWKKAWEKRNTTLKKLVIK